ncbi:MAG: DEAD/DEAH box helicase family protein [Thermoanaerobaculia bacterium]
MHYNSLSSRQRRNPMAPCLVVVFSTYQSIEAVSKAQKVGLPSFDLIICDEAHRTTGVTLTDEDESAFVKVHDAKFLKGHQFHDRDVAHLRRRRQEQGHGFR